jgi:ornithine carbamoyltransferase
MKHLLSVRDLTPETIKQLFADAARMKRNKQHARPLVGKTLGLMFQKPSVRTRVSFEVGMAQLGGQSLYIGPVDLQGGARETAHDLAKVLSRYLDGIVARTFAHKDVEDMARASSVPIINGLSDGSHPCQALADLFTVQEKLGRLSGVKVAYVGDGNNVCHSLMEASALAGVQLTVAAPAGYKPEAEVVRWSQSQAKKTGARIDVIDGPKEAVQGAAVIYTDVWTSMGQEKEQAQRRNDFKAYQINAKLMKAAPKGAFFMHCLPAHRGEEVTDEVMDSRNSIVYDQAENRMHVQKAILLDLLK